MPTYLLLLFTIILFGCESTFNFMVNSKVSNEDEQLANFNSIPAQETNPNNFFTQPLHNHFSGKEKANYTLSCFYDTNLDGKVRSLNNCNSIESFSFSASNATIEWNPSPLQKGIYEIKLIARNEKSLHQTETIFSISVHEFSGGIGTPENPFIIDNVIQLNDIKLFNKSNFRLNQDLNLSGFNYEAPNTFQGNFDGNNKKLMNWSINSPTQNDIGFFGKLESATINNIVFSNANLNIQNNSGFIANSINKNSKIENIYITGKLVGKSEIGAIAGSISESVAKHVHFKGSLTSTENAGNSNSGALFGTAINSNILKTSVYGEIISQSNNVGSLVGNSINSTVSESYSFIDLKAPMSDSVGGLIGKCSNCTIKNSISRGDVHGDTKVGGLIGESNISQLENVVSTSRVLASDQDTFGALVGHESGSSLSINSFFDISATETSQANGLLSQNIAHTALYMPTIKSPVNTRSLGNSWKLESAQYPNLQWRSKGNCDPQKQPFGGGHGTLYSPYLICSKEHMEELVNYRTGHHVFALKDNLDMAITSYDMSPYESEYGELIFLGNNYQLENYSFASSSHRNISLFGLLSNSVIEDLKVNNFNITAHGATASLASSVNTSNQDYHIGLYSNVIVENSNILSTYYGWSTTSGIFGDFRFNAKAYDIHARNITLQNTNSYGHNIGGIFGVMGAKAQASRVISHEVSILNNAQTNRNWMAGLVAGGLVNTTDWSGATLRQAKAFSTVASTGRSRSGGLIGAFLDGEVIDSYADVTLNFNIWSGGLIGTHGWGTGDPSMTRAWVVANIMSTTNVCNGIVFGKDEGNSNVFSEVYADVEASSITNLTGCGSDTGYSGANTAVMQSAAQYSNWPAEIWIIPNGSDYPRFTWE